MIYIYELEPISAEGFFILLLLAPAIVGLGFGYNLLDRQEKYFWGVVSIVLGLGITLFLTLGGVGLALLTSMLPALLSSGPSMYFYNNDKSAMSFLVIGSGIVASGFLFFFLLSSGQLNI